MTYAQWCGDGSCDWNEDCSSCPDDCGPCQWCGDGSCNNGEDCSSCESDCGACPPSGPSCGELGGDGCSQSGQCPPGYDSLGTTYDCNPCCKQQPPPPPPGPSCGDLGGNHCSQSGSCPSGYDFLGITYDCNPCCRQPPPPPPPEVLYTYEDYAIDGSTFWAFGTAETSGSRPVRVDVTMFAPDRSVMINCSGCGAPSSGTDAFRSVGPGDYDVILDYYWCDEPGPARRINRRIPVGLSTTCWNGYQRIPVGNRIVCSYIGMTYGCTASCIPAPGVPQHVEGEGSFPGCPPKVAYSIPFYLDPRGGKRCSAVGYHTDFWSPADPCSCGDIPDVP